MLVVETISKIRHYYFKQGKSIRNGATEFIYERNQQPHPQIDPWRNELGAMLECERLDRQPRQKRLLLVSNL